MAGPVRTARAWFVAASTTANCSTNDPAEQDRSRTVAIVPSLGAASWPTFCCAIVMTQLHISLRLVALHFSAGVGSWLSLDPNVVAAVAEVARKANPATPTKACFHIGTLLFKCPRWPIHWETRYSPSPCAARGRFGIRAKTGHNE